MKENTKTWLQMYVDAMTERDPYKRLALVQELRRIPRHDESDELMGMVLESRPARKEVRRSSEPRHSSKLQRSRTR